MNYYDLYDYELNRRYYDVENKKRKYIEIRKYYNPISPCELNHYKLYYYNTTISDIINEILRDYINNNYLVLVKNLVMNMNSPNQLLKNSIISNKNESLNSILQESSYSLSIPAFLNGSSSSFDSHQFTDLSNNEKEDSSSMILKISKNRMFRGYYSLQKINKTIFDKEIMNYRNNKLIELGDILNPCVSDSFYLILDNTQIKRLIQIILNKYNIDFYLFENIYSFIQIKKMNNRFLENIYNRSIRTLF
jgi:hypothetical protein